MFTPSNTSNAIVSDHAVRRFAESTLGRTESLAAGDDNTALWLLDRAGVDTAAIRARLQLGADSGLRHGGRVVLQDKARLVLRARVLRTVMPKAWRMDLAWHLRPA
ncbi:hypothetical protein [Chenggangzhangella methanolivorans]|uniref:Uncharacterized protein n=1 Tax=Chenggangzhangella methanolivorans TaxID=1437009 RepID=A0A9E6RFX7_9HYPH|nr:hypothetical protein [Chenggangzhangella methanolivorans]QZO00636.1 hypothetical protein K6K41_02665 [Chenggangzhangella methanolivorans]